MQRPTSARHQTRSTRRLRWLSFRDQFTVDRAYGKMRTCRRSFAKCTTRAAPSEDAGMPRARTGLPHPRTNRTQKSPSSRFPKQQRITQPSPPRSGEPLNSAAVLPAASAQPNQRLVQFSSVARPHNTTPGPRLHQVHPAHVRSSGLPTHGAQVPAFGSRCPFTKTALGKSWQSWRMLKHVMPKDQRRAWPPRTLKLPSLALSPKPKLHMKHQFLHLQVVPFFRRRPSCRTWA